MRRLITALLFALPAAPYALNAQSTTQAWLLTPGRRVRVTYPGIEDRTGSLVGLTEDTLSVQWDNSADTARMARSRIQRFGVSRGMRESSRSSRAKIGFVVGAGAVVLISEATYKKTGGLEDIGEGIAMILGAGMVGGIGALIGVATGGPSESWENVRLGQPQVGIVLPTRSHGAGLGVALAF